MKPVQIIRGRIIRENEILNIRELLQANPNCNRTWISREICRQWGWVRPNGQLKDMACRELLVRLERQNLIQLPARQREGSNHRRYGEWIRDTEKSGIFNPEGFKEEAMTGTLGDYGKVKLELMSSRAQRKFWNTLIDKYHYLGYRCTVGPSLKYLIYLQERVVGCMGWASGVWKLGLRDRYIGWEMTGQQKGLSSIVNNVRFLIFPWVKIRYLASHVLSVSAKKVKEDWEGLYQLRAYLLESFVDRERFRGTCYKAANWIYLGQTQGKSKRGLRFYFHGHSKDVYIYPLSPDFRERLREQ